MSRLETKLRKGVDVLREEGPVALAKAARDDVGLAPHERAFKRDRLRMRIERHRRHEIGLCGNYTTGNVGDHAIGKALSLALSAGGHDVQQFSKFTGPTRSEYAVLGGGGVLHDHIPGALEKRLSFLDSTNAIVGIGYQHVASESGRRLLRAALEDAEVVAARDRRSREKLAELCDREVELAACAAFMLEPPDVPTTGRTGIHFRPWLGIGAYGDAETLRTYFGYESDLDVERAGRQYLENMHRVIERVEDPVYVPLHPNDVHFAEEYLDVPVLPYDPSVDTALARIASVERMVCTRYHSNVFSVLCGKPMLSVAYAPKVAQLAERAGVPQVRPHADDVEVEFARPDPEKREEILAASERNVELIERMVSGRAGDGASTAGPPARPPERSP